jgi:hypothetical protein
MATADDVAQQFYILRTMMVENRKYGAMDSEPIHKVNFVLSRRFLHKNPNLPRTAMEWELYSMAGAEAAATKLYTQLDVVCRVMDNMVWAEGSKLKELPEFYFLED